jgi:hypothetical protein
MLEYYFEMFIINTINRSILAQESCLSSNPKIRGGGKVNLYIITYIINQSYLCEQSRDDSFISYHIIKRHRRQLFCRMTTHCQFRRRPAQRSQLCSPYLWQRRIHCRSPVVFFKHPFRSHEFPDAHFKRPRFDCGFAAAHLKRSFRSRGFVAAYFKMLAAVADKPSKILEYYH